MKNSSTFLFFKKSVPHGETSPCSVLIGHAACWYGPPGSSRSVVIARRQVACLSELTTGGKCFLLSSFSELVIDTSSVTKLYTAYSCVTLKMGVYQVYFFVFSSTGPTRFSKIVAAVQYYYGRSGRTKARSQSKTRRMS